VLSPTEVLWEDAIATVDKTRRVDMRTELKRLHERLKAFAPEHCHLFDATSGQRNFDL